jgi:hypothetical protein
MIMSTNTMGTASLINDDKYCASGSESISAIHAVQPAGRRVSIAGTDFPRVANSAWRSFSTDFQNPITDRVPSCVGVRFNLRKRAATEDRREVALNPCNSAFLTDLFADIANANGPSGNEVSEHENSRLDSVKSSKRSRLSMSRSISRCGKSFANFSAVVEGGSQGVNASPKAVQFFDGPTASIHSSSFKNGKSVTNSCSSTDNPFPYQLHCVLSSSSSESEAVASSDISKLAFPHLPATVSNSSCNNLSSLTRSKSGRQSSDGETSTKDGYGWFVETEEDEFAVAPVIAYSKAISPADLAFSAVTAPKRANYDAELEWAQAADTVDDVLGDFF